MKAQLTDEILNKSSIERLVDIANFQPSCFLILPEDDATIGLVKNATIVKNEPYNVAPFTARVHFEIDRNAQPVPYGEKVPEVPTFVRTVNIRQIRAGEIVERYGVGDVVYLSLAAMPTKTTDLAGRFKELFGLEIKKEDILEQDISPNTNCIIVRFSPKSIGYIGAMRVDLTTKVYG